MAGLAGQSLRDLPAWRVTEIPRRPPGAEQPAGGEGDLDLAQRVAALVSAYHSKTGPVAVGWLRLAAGGPVQVLAGVRGLAGGVLPGGALALALPAGGRGTPLPAGAMAASLARIPCWVRIAGLAEGMVSGPVPGEPAQGGAAAARRARPSLEDGLLAVWP
nr:ATP-binding protein [Actinomycetota bacterium]